MSTKIGTRWEGGNLVYYNTDTGAEIFVVDANGNRLSVGDLGVDTAKINESLVIPRTTGKGIKLHPDSPSFGWCDMLGRVIARTTGATVPSFASYRGNLYQYQFTNGVNVKEMFQEFHIPHDYVPNTDMYIHIHWSQNVVDTGGAAAVPGNAKWYFDISYADGYGTPGGAAQAFIAPITTSVVQQGSTTQYGHMIAEVQFTGETTTASTIAKSAFKIDGLILVRVYRDSTDAADTLDQSPFLHFIDIHYQTNGVAGTFSKNTPFYT
jgi:hypothetical protein